MYYAFYGLDRPPFNLTPDPRFLFLSRRHEEALVSLEYGIASRKGFTVLTGEIGAGKTTLCRTLVRRLGATTRVALILNSALSDLELLQAINDEYGVHSASTSRKELVDALNGYLLTQNAAGHDCLLIIDEAQNLAPSTLEQVRLLSNLETETDKLIQILLMGQPELRDTLRLPGLEQLNQRITVRHHLLPLDREDVEAYVHHRLHVAAAEGSGGHQVAFTPAAFDLIHRFSGGVPRKVNLVVDRALLAGYAAEARTITESLVEQAIREVAGEGASDGAARGDVGATAHAGMAAGIAMGGAGGESLFGAAAGAAALPSGGGAAPVAMAAALPPGWGYAPGAGGALVAVPYAPGYAAPGFATAPPAPYAGMFGGGSAASYGASIPEYPARDAARQKGGRGAARVVALLVIMAAVAAGTAFLVRGDLRPAPWRGDAGGPQPGAGASIAAAPDVPSRNARTATEPPAAGASSDAGRDAAATESPSATAPETAAAAMPALRSPARPTPTATPASPRVARRVAPWTRDEQGIVRVERPEHTFLATQLTVVTSFFGGVSLDVAGFDGRSEGILQRLRLDELPSLARHGLVLEETLAPLPVVRRVGHPAILRLAVAEGGSLSPYVVLPPVASPTPGEPITVWDPRHGVLRLPRERLLPIVEGALLLAFDAGGATRLTLGDANHAVLSLQTALVEQGSWPPDAPPPTGIFDETTLTAVAMYQGQRALPETGRLDLLTLLDLLPSGAWRQMDPDVVLPDGRGGTGRSEAPPSAVAGGLTVPVTPVYAQPEGGGAGSSEGMPGGASSLLPDVGDLRLPVHRTRAGEATPDLPRFEEPVPGGAEMSTAGAPPPPPPPPPSGEEGAP